MPYHKLTVGQLGDILAIEDDATEVRIAVHRHRPQQLRIEAVTLLPYYHGVALTEFDAVTPRMLAHASPVLWIATSASHTRQRPPAEAWQSAFEA